VAFPVVEGVAESSVNTAGTSHAVTLPASIASTDEVLILMDIGSTSATLNALTDWGELLDENAANGLKILRYTGAGVPSNPTFTSSATTRSASIAYRISGADKTVTPQIGTTATGTSATPDPPSVTPTGGVSKPYLFIAFFGQAGEEADDDTWANTPPTNYTPSPPRQKTCGTAGTNLGGLIASAERALMTGSAEDPGTFGVDVSAAWRAQTIIVHPLALTGTAAWTDDADVLAGSGTAGSGGGGGPLTVTARGANDNGTTSSASVSLSAFTPTADSLLIVAAMVEEDGDGTNSAIDVPTGLPAGASAFTAVNTAMAAIASFEKGAGMWRSQMPASPASTTINQAGTNDPAITNCWIALAACDITGHNTSTPVVQNAPAGASTWNVGTPTTTSTTFGSGLTVGNLVIAAVCQSVVSGSGAPTPTIGGQAMTSVVTNGANDYEQIALFKRTITGAESNSTVSVAASGGTEMYGHVVLAVEIAAAAGGGGGVEGTAAWTDDADVLAASGASTHTGTAAWTEDADTLAASGAITRVAVAAWTDDADVLAASGTAGVGINGPAAWTEDADSVAAAGKITRLGVIAWTDDADTFAAEQAVGGFPYAISGNDRYIVDVNGDPWFMAGDAVWALMSMLTQADAEDYLDAISARGVNCIMVSLIESYYTTNPDADALGNPAYTGTMFQSTPGAAYWSHVDDVIAYAETVGITLLAFPAYLGFDNDGVRAQVAAASNAQMQAYGEFLGQRYATAPNIIWVAGGDRGTSVAITATEKERTDYMMTGIRLHAPQLMTGHTFDGDTADSIWGSYSWLDINNSYKANRDPVTLHRTAYADTPTRPAFYVEGQYEQERSPLVAHGDRLLRIQMWSAPPAGLGGHVFGNSPRWHLGAGNPWDPNVILGTWQESIDHPAGNYDAGTIHLQHWATFWRDQGIEWWNLVPDTTNTFLTASPGSSETEESAGFYAAGSLAVVYAPTTGSLTLDLTELNAVSQVRIRRYDPTAGTFSTVGTYATTGSQSITHPGNNSFGHSDWVYLIEPTGGATGTAAWTEDADTFAASGASTHSGTAAWTEADDTVTAAGYLPNDGTAAWTEDADTLAAAGKITRTGTSAWVEDADVLASSGRSTHTGTAAWLEDADVLAASGASGLDVEGPAAWTEADDTLAAAGKGGRIGTAAITDADDTITVAGIVGHTGTAAWVEDDDTSAATGSGTNVATVAWTEDADVFSATGGLGRVGTGAWTEDADVFAAYAGILGPIITGTLTTTAVDTVRDTTAADADRTTTKVDR
jgi:hypothetical protein